VDDKQLVGDRNNRKETIISSACTILCPIIDYAKVLDAIESSTVSGEWQLEGMRDKWARVTAVHSGKQIVFSALIRLQPRDKFSRLVLSMHDFFRTVKTDILSNQDYVLSRIANVEMMIGVVADPEFTIEDSRLDTLWKIAECVDAVVFNGNAILDAHGKRILDNSGHFDVVVN